MNNGSSSRTYRRGGRSLWERVGRDLSGDRSTPEKKEKNRSPGGSVQESLGARGRTKKIMGGGVRKGGEMGKTEERGGEGVKHHNRTRSGGGNS